MNRLLHRILYRLLPLEQYLEAVSGLYFLTRKLHLGRRSPALEYGYHLPQLVRAGDVCIDIGANLGYYARPLARLVGSGGKVYAVEPVPVICRVLRRNLRGCANVEVMPCALGERNASIRMANDTPRTAGYFGTGRNYVARNEGDDAAVFEAEMRRGSELFDRLDRIDFIKCDIEGYEATVLEEMRGLLERHRPVVLVETGGENRRRVTKLFASMGYEAFILEAGRERPLTPSDGKDIIFRPGAAAAPRNEH